MTPGIELQAGVSFVTEANGGKVGQSPPLAKLSNHRRRGPAQSEKGGRMTDETMFNWSSSCLVYMMIERSWNECCSCDVIYVVWYAQNPSRFIHKYSQRRAHALALSFLLITSLRCFLANITWKRPKSLSDRLFSNASRLCVHFDFSHLSKVASFSSCFFITPEPAPRGSFDSLRGVRTRCL